MKPDYVLIFTTTVLFGQCHSLYNDLAIRSRSQVDSHVPSNSPLWRAWRNSTELPHKRVARRIHCSLHRDCRTHEFCGCSSYCQNKFDECNRGKRSLDPHWSEEKDYEDFARAQRDCDSKRGDRRLDSRCDYHSDCGCNRHCSCHGFCTYICHK